MKIRLPKLRKLNSLGMSHIVVPLVAVLVIGGIGSYVASKAFSHASTVPDTPLEFIMTQGTGSGTVEIHRLSASSGYQTVDLAKTTRFNINTGSHGTFQMVGSDLYFIQTSGTGSGKVEIHSATAASGYKSGIDVATALSASAGNAGTFQLVGHDLYFIQTNGTGSGTVEIHALSGSSNYQSFSLHTTTAFAIGNGSAGTWRIVSNNNLAFIKTSGTGSGKVELHIVTAASGYKTYSLHATTGFSTGDAANGYFSAEDVNNDGVTDVSLIKVRNTGSGKVEVFYSEGSSYATTAYAKASSLSTSLGSSGQWSIGDPVVSASSPPPAPSGQCSNGSWYTTGSGGGSTYYSCVNGKWVTESCPSGQNAVASTSQSGPCYTPGGATGSRTCSQAGGTVYQSATANGNPHYCHLPYNAQIACVGGTDYRTSAPINFECTVGGSGTEPLSNYTLCSSASGFVDTSGPYDGTCRTTDGNSNFIGFCDLAPSAPYSASNCYEFPQ